MALPSLTLRQTKGSPLTFNEMDTNLTNLQTADFNVSVGSTTTNIRFDSTLTLAGGAGISINLTTSTRTLTVGLTTATTSTVGGIKVGSNLTITADGTLSATASGSGFTGTVAILTATQSVIVGGITLQNDGTNNLSVVYVTSTSTSTTALSSDIRFQMRLENNYVDDALATTTATNNGSVTFASASRFSTYSLDFGTDATQTTKNIATTNTNSLNFGTGDFTIESWVYTPTHTIQAPNYYHKIFQNSAATKYLAFNDNGSSYDVFWADDVNSQYFAAGGSPVLSNDNWHHIVAMRKAGVLYLGYDGTMTNKGAYTYTTDFSNIKIGGNQSIGKIDSIRVSNTSTYGTSSYTVPTAEFSTGVVTTTTTYTTSSALAYLPLAGGTLLGDIVLDGVRETVVNHGNVTGTLTPNVSSGTIHKMTLVGNITLNTLTNVATGSSLTIVMTQDSTGTRTLTNTGWKWLGGNKTLSTTGTNIDIVTVFYDGSIYYASLGKGYA